MPAQRLPPRLPWSPVTETGLNNDNNFKNGASSPWSPSSVFVTTTPTPNHLDDIDTTTPAHEYGFWRALISGKKRKSYTGEPRTPSKRVDSAVVCGIGLPESVLVAEGRGLRSFSLPTEKIMMANVSVESVNDDGCIPSSPPELSYSKSSKSSSSINSDDLSDAELTSKEGHFEEVNLEDGGRDSGDDCNLPPDSRPTLRRPPPKSLTTSDISTLPRTRGAISPKRSPLGPLPNGSRQRYPSLQGAVNGVLRDQSLNLPNGRSMQRAVTSPVSPFMQRHPSRSPSPSKPFMQNGYSVSPQTLASATPKASYETPKENGTLQRRPSWQPGRKTTKELEAEYNDEDEEVPEEAILENVPISPMPGQYHSFKSPPMNRGVRSLTPSPHRRSPHANLHSANIPKQAKRPSLPTGHYASPRSPKHGRPQMPHSATVAAFPPGEPLSRKHRSKSWTEDLNEEARQLSQALEEYSEKLSLEKRHSASNTPSSSPPRPSLTKSATMANVKELPTLPVVPPVQKGNIMIDPLPISKEKEAVLTRTRPSWLPPKCQKEERKHLKEFQQMMARAAEAEKKRALKEQENKENREEMQGSIARIWDQHVLPNWDAVVKEPRTRELWWRGVTPRSRGEVWQKAVGNELELSATSFEAALARASALEEKIAEMPDEERNQSKEAAWLDAIDRDVPHVYPELRMYQHDGPLHKSLTNVLRAFAMYRSDVGYVYGTHLIAGVVCLLLPPPQAFVLLANMLNRPLPLAFLVHDQVAMGRTYKYCLSTLKYKFTKLHDHLTNPAVGLSPEEFLDPIFRCLFAYHLSHEHVSRILDVFVFEGDKTLVRAAVACLGKLERKLYGSKEEILGVIGWMNEERWDVGSEDEFMEAVREAGKVDGTKERERIPSSASTTSVNEPIPAAA